MRQVNNAKYVNGVKVDIKDFEYTYDVYSEFFETGNAEETALKPRFVEGKLPKNGESGTVLFSANHTKISSITIYCVEMEDGSIYLIDEGGLDFCSSEGTGINAGEVTYKEPILTAKMKKELRDEMKSLLAQYGWTAKDQGLNKLIDTWWENKGKKFARLFSAHPNYDGKWKIVFDKDYERTTDVQAIKNFVTFWENNFSTDKFMTLNKTDEGLTRDEAMRKYEFSVRVINFYNDWSRFINDLNINGKTLEQWQGERAKYRIAKEMKAYTVDSVAKKDNYLQVLRWIRDNRTHLLTKADADKLNSLMVIFDPKFKVNEGQKVSRVVNKICLLFGFDKYEREESVRVVGSEPPRYERKMVKPYEREFAKYADAINPLTIKRHTVLSIHPVDYLTQSFGNSWSSCHTIDKANIRKCSSDTYEGMHCDGTISYMLDGTSMVLYTVDGSYEGTKIELEDKIIRNMFHYGEDKLLQGRIYPQGTDGETGTYKIYREIVQEVMAYCLGQPNLWKNEKGTSICNTMGECKGTCYPDWRHNSSCNVSFLKATGRNEKPMIIGAKPLCIECGEPLRNQGTLNCCSSFKEPGNTTGTRICSDCGEEYSEDEMHLIDGEWYCEDCCYFCDYHEEWELGDEYRYVNDYGNVCEDALNYSDSFDICHRCGEWFYSGDGDYETDIHDNVYCSTYCAERENIYLDSVGCYVPRGEVEYCAECDTPMLREEAIEHNGEYYCEDCHAELTESESA